MDEGLVETLNNGYDRCLVGSFLTNRKINFGAMQETLSSIWRPVKGVFMEESNYPNLFIFKFFHELDIKRVLDDGPWTFNQQVLLLKKLDVNEQLKDVKLTDLYMWIQIYDLPIGFNSEIILKSIGNYMGKFLEVDPKNFKGLGKNYLRIKVALDVRRPLKIGMKIKKAGGDWLWINFKYERLPSFCFYCGLIGHSDKFCEALFDNPQHGEERKFSSTLRAPIRRQSNSNGNQWFRDANGGYGGLPVGGDGREGQVTNSRDSRVVERESSNQGYAVTKFASNQEEEFEDILKSNEDIPNNEGLVVSKQKRARIDNLNEKDMGLNQEQNIGLDTIMGESVLQKNQKNLLLAGPVVQARQSQ